MQTAFDAQHDPPQVTQQVPFTQLCPPGHEPVGFEELHEPPDVGTH
jgi:hypothetical protein